ncbi:unnamed protein product, partial [marine sediment metagenome]
LLTGGCARLGEETATVALRFTDQDTTAYRLTTQAEDSIKFEGASLKGPDFKDSRNYGEIELTFTQQIQSVNEQGNAVAKITIDHLKYLLVRADETLLDFDSAREKDSNSPMAKLIGQGYTLEITPAGEVSKIIDVSRPRTEVEAGSVVAKVISGLFSPQAINERHSNLALPPSSENRLEAGDTWSNVKGVSFRAMGSKAYERVYKLKQVEHTNGK